MTLTLHGSIPLHLVCHSLYRMVSLAHLRRTFSKFSMNFWDYTHAISKPRHLREAQVLVSSTELSFNIAWILEAFPNCSIAQAGQVGPASGRARNWQRLFVLSGEVGFGAAVLTNIIECVQNVFSKRHDFACSSLAKGCFQSPNSRAVRDHRQRTSLSVASSKVCWETGSPA